MPVRGEDEHHEPPEQVSAQGDGEKWGRPLLGAGEPDHAHQADELEDGAE